MPLLTGRSQWLYIPLYRLHERGGTMLIIPKRIIAALVVGGVATLTAAPSAQSPAPPPTTAVLVNLTIKADADRSQVMAVLPDEVRATVKLYLDGKIQQWYSRGDGRGV